MTGIKSSRASALACSLAIVAAASPALAVGPEQIEQLEPEGGEWQAEVSLLASGDTAASSSFQLLRGLSDHVAIGLEVEGEWSGGKVSLDGFAPTILYRLSDGSDGVGVGFVGQIEFVTDLNPVAAEARVLIERKARRWWGQGNAIVVVEHEEGKSAATLGYGWRISRSLGKAACLGAEGSGQVARLSGSALASGARGHYIGPALTIAFDLRSGAELEVDASYLRRAAGEGPRGALQLSAQINL